MFIIIARLPLPSIIVPKFDGIDSVGFEVYGLADPVLLDPNFTLALVDICPEVGAD